MRIPITVAQTPPIMHAVQGVELLGVEVGVEVVLVEEAEVLGTAEVFVVVVVAIVVEEEEEEEEG